MLSPWPAIIAELQREQSMSMRALARHSGVCRGTIIRFTQLKVSLRIDQLERILAVFDYELEAVPIDTSEEMPCPTLHPTSANAAVRLLTGRVAPAE